MARLPPRHRRVRGDGLRIQRYRPRPVHDLLRDRARLNPRAEGQHDLANVGVAEVVEDAVAAGDYDVAAEHLRLEGGASW
jgi:hypothetical protein